MFFHTIEKTKYLSPAFLFLTSTHKTKCFFTNQTKQQKKELKTKNSDDTKKNQFNFFFAKLHNLFLCICPLKIVQKMFPFYYNHIFFDQIVSDIFV